MGERVIWSGAFGGLAAVVTDRRFMVVSVGAEAWTAMRLQMDEPGLPVAAISSNLALVSTGERVVGYDAVAGEFIEWRHRMWERVSTLSVERDIAVVIAGRGVAGYAAGQESFVEMGFAHGETYETHQIFGAIVTVRTTRRLLAFDSVSATWSEERRPLSD